MAKNAEGETKTIQLRQGRRGARIECDGYKFCRAQGLKEEKSEPLVNLSEKSCQNHLIWNVKGWGAGTELFLVVSESQQLFFHSVVCDKEAIIRDRHKPKGVQLVISRILDIRDRTFERRFIPSDQSEL